MPETALDLSSMEKSDLIGIIERQERDSQQTQKENYELAKQVRDLLMEISNLKEQHGAADALISYLQLKIQGLLKEIEFGDQERMKLTVLVEQLDKKSQKDPKFDVFNRSGFLESVDSVRGLLRRGKTDSLNKEKPEGSVMIVDIDKFKSINDSYGHPVGDLAIESLILHLRSIIRNSDVIGRWGGEEFVIFFPDASAEEIFQKFKDQGQEYPAVKVSFSTEKIKEKGTEISFTVSGGVVSLKKNERTEDAIGRADKLLYQAKNEGRNRIYME